MKMTLEQLPTTTDRIELTIFMLWNYALPALVFMAVGASAAAKDWLSGGFYMLLGVFLTFMKVK